MPLATDLPDRCNPPANLPSFSNSPELFPNSAGIYNAAFNLILFYSPFAWAKMRI